MFDVERLASMAVCAVIIMGTVVYIRNVRRQRREAEEQERREKHEAALTVSMTGGTGGKSLNLTAEELQRDFERLCVLFGKATEPPRKSEAPAEAPKPAAPTTFSEAPEAMKLPASAQKKPAEASKRPAGPLKTELKAKPESPRKGSENIQSEIEQAVKETQ